jgi:hypothetical protein
MSISIGPEAMSQIVDLTISRDLSRNKIINILIERVLDSGMLEEIIIPRKGPRRENVAPGAVFIGIRIDPFLKSRVIEVANTLNLTNSHCVELLVNEGLLAELISSELVRTAV